MALTNFAALTDEQKTAWSRDLWRVARNSSFINQFTGSGHNSMIQKISELTKSEKGARAVLSLVADLEGDGIAGDAMLEGNEEAMKAYDTIAAPFTFVFLSNLHSTYLIIHMRPK